MKSFSLALLAIGAIVILAAAADKPAGPMVTGLKNPRAVAVGPDGRVYVTVTEDLKKTGTGAVMAIENCKEVPFATGLDVPLYMARWQNWLFVTDKECVWRIDRTGKADKIVRLADFVGLSGGFRGICVDERGMVYVTALSRERTTVLSMETGLVRMNQRGKSELLFADKPQTSRFGVSGIAMDGMSFLVGLDNSGQLLRLDLSDGSVKPVGQGTGGALEIATYKTGAYRPAHGGVTWDHNGRLYVSGFRGHVQVLPRPDQLVGDSELSFEWPGGPCLAPDGKSILVPDVKAGTITSVPIGDPRDPVDESPLPFATEVAFPDLEWSGWASETASGKPNPLRPLVLTHANDGSGRNFVATQHGIIHVFRNDQAAKKTKVFLDIQSKVRYDDKTNEEGFLGLAFHPDFKKTGELFVFYTEKTPGHNNVLSRFHVSKDDPDRADSASEEVLLRVQHKYWNHDGGTVIFGPDGFLYLALGDGGLGNDPDGNGQNLNTLLGKIIRIDVNRRDGDLPYGIPKDNPFVGRSNARPEVFAYGLRNVWRMAFDRQTGRFWAADVGQNLYEEIDLIVKGGNYGWGIREGLHPFGPKGVGPKPDLIDPIWEYDHEVGKSITGGAVYRGSRFPELVGMYLYADYVSGKIWALQYKESSKRVLANRPIADRKLAIMSFGEDDRGELYVMTYSQNGQGIYRFMRSPAVSSK